MFEQSLWRTWKWLRCGCSSDLQSEIAVGWSSVGIHIPPDCLFLSQDTSLLFVLMKPSASETVIIVWHLPLLSLLKADSIQKILITTQALCWVTEVQSGFVCQLLLGYNRLFCVFKIFQLFLHVNTAAAGCLSHVPLLSDKHALRAPLVLKSDGKQESVVWSASSAIQLASCENISSVLNVNRGGCWLAVWPLLNQGSLEAAVVVSFISTSK